MKNQAGVLAGILVLLGSGLAVEPTMGQVVVGFSQESAQIPRGVSAVMTGYIDNQTGDVVYLKGLSGDISDKFAGADVFDDFLQSAPASLAPGESWEGPFIRLTVAPDAPQSTNHQLWFSVTGGAHPYDAYELGSVAIQLDDSVSVSAVPGGPPAGGPPMVSRPNPFADRTFLAFNLSVAGRIEVSVYDIKGSPVRSLFGGPMDEGGHVVEWDGRNDSGQAVGPGIYFIRLKTLGETLKTKVVLIQ